MGDAVGYAKSLAKLIEALKTSAPESVLKAELLRVRSHARSQALELQLAQDGSLLVQGAATDSMSWDLRALIDAMRAHGVVRITVLEDAVPKELLHLAIILSNPAPRSENDPTAVDQARDLALWSVRIMPEQKAETTSAQSVKAAEFNSLPPNEIEARAAEVVAQADAAVASGDASAALSSLSLLHIAEADAPDEERRAKWQAAFERAATPAALHLAAGLLPDAGSESGALRALLKRAGEAGAEVLITLLPTASTLTRRRVYFDAIVELGMGVRQLIAALGAAQWFVVRNAAVLLGELKAAEAEPALGQLLSHPDERVRIAAIAALVQMGRPSARVLVQWGIHDGSAQVRRRAIGAFGQEKGVSVSASPLLQALAVERDLEVEVEILYALGRVASADAVQKLIRLCSQSGAADKPASYRIAAIEGLTVARRSAALPILKSMLTDSEAEVRATARNLIESVNAMAGSR